jgi:hypothetical protein
VPALLELALALRAIRDGWDPIRHLLHGPTPVGYAGADWRARITLVDERARELAVRQAAVDALERRLRRDRRPGRLFRRRWPRS